MYAENKKVSSISVAINRLMKYESPTMSGKRSMRLKNVEKYGNRKFFLIKIETSSVANAFQE
jgi:hypothetical protein